MNLTHHFLIAMPGLEGSFFARSVVYLCEHNEHGALGLVINKPTDICMQDLFDQMELSLGRRDISLNMVFKGGPMQTERGFVLHDPVRATMATDEGEVEDSGYTATMSIVGGGLDMTTSRDVLEALSCGVGPQRVMVTLGYSSWERGQLESELADNNWLTVEADPAVIFDTFIEDRYSRALALLGLQTWMLSSEAGHA